MKKIKLLLFSFLFTTLAFGQMQDLEKLAEGKLVYSSTLFNSNDDLYGYFYLYQRDMDKQHVTMEYVVLDKNLNKFANGTFVNDSYSTSKLNLYNITSNYLDCTLMGDCIVLSSCYNFKIKLTGDEFPATNAFQIISLKDNKVSKVLKYQDGEFKDMPSDFSTLKKENYKLENSYYIQAFENESIKGFFVSQVDKYGYVFKEKEIRFFNENRELLWKYEYNPKPTSSDYTLCELTHASKGNLYLIETVVKNSNVVEKKLILLDLKTGNKKYEYLLENNKSIYNHTFKMKEINGKLFITGNYSLYKKGYTFRLKKNLGYFKIVLDENGKENSHQYTKWTDFASEMLIDKVGRDKKKFSLKTRRIFLFNDSTISFVTEKYKPETDLASWVPIPLVFNLVFLLTHQKERTTDFAVVNMTKDFKLKSIKTINKELTKEENNDYLFSQYIKKGEGGALFYKDYRKNPETKKDQWMLGISTIVNGEITDEKIPMYSKKKYLVDPFPAKEGYVMLREYNEKEKYNQVRLEKLNF